jgi:exo beta-1,2-glucooligosaccharide sophorohydrolase (non-reducing end)
MILVFWSLNILEKNFLNRFEIMSNNFKKIAALSFILFFANFSFGADFIFFNDSPNNTYYDPSFGFSQNGSTVITANGDKFPVDVNHKYSGTNALRLMWKSVAGGEWGIAVAEQGWIAHDVTVKDSITFEVYTGTTVDSSSLISIYLEDIQNVKTPKQSLENYINKIEKGKWTKVSVPLSIFIQNPGNADLTKIKTIYFGQGFADGSLHLIYLDEIRMIAAGDIDTTAPSVPTGLTASTASTTINLSWNPNTETDLAGYRIYRSNGGDYEIIGFKSRADTSYGDNAGIPPKTFSYKISAYDSSGNESALSEKITASTTSASDSALLDMVQKATFKYFWDYAHPVSGLARERLGSGETCAIGGSGFGVMAILVGIEREFITRAQGIARMLIILNFLTTKADRFHGAFPHWMNGSTGKVIPFSAKDDGGDLVETSYMIEGLLTAREYFDQDNSDEKQIRDLITSIWESVEWDWYRKDNGDFLFWHWSPNYNWDMNFPIQGFNETMITYLLAIASPTHPVPSNLYYKGWASSPNYKNGKSYYGIPLYVGWDYGGPLFFAHYSFLGFDPRGKKDIYTNYFINNKNYTLIDQAYCANNPKNFPGYNADTWGLTASDNPWGYGAQSPTNDNGTISPTAALSSMPYTPELSMRALKSFYYVYGNNLWGTYGFYDAFNIDQNWYASSYIAIDEGPIIDMIENYRSQLLWKNFMTNPEIRTMLDAIGFVPDSTTTSVDDFQAANMLYYKLIGNYPNPFNPSTILSFVLLSKEKVEIKIFDILGREVKDLFNGEMNQGANKVEWNGKDNFGKTAASGIYLYSVKANGKILNGKMILEK